jgi:hypothetical protein
MCAFRTEYIPTVCADADTRPSGASGSILSRMNGISDPDEPMGDLPDNWLFPEPVAVISLRNAVTYRDVDEDGQPILIITDGVTAVALDSGLAGLSFGVVVASYRLADAVHDFAQSITARRQKRAGARAGRHRGNRHRMPARRQRSNASTR